MAFLGLHGFSQRGPAWAEVAGAVGGDWLLPDLPGHGAEPVVPWEAAVARIGGFLAALPPPRVLAGYSFGGRLALAAALDSPHLVDRLVLVSAAPGIADDAERRRRRGSDAALADRIGKIGVEAFVAEWMERPMFSGLGARGPEWVARDRASRATNTPAGLAGALETLGQGAQPYLGERLAALQIPVLLLAGARDAGYAALATEMAARIPAGRAEILPGAGHPLLGEAPTAVATSITTWMT